MSSAIPASIPCRSSWRWKRKRGAKTIGITSAEAYAGAKSRHSSGKKLIDVVDLVIDSRVPVGDAILQLDGMEAKVGAASTVLGAALMNVLVAQASAKLLERGVQPPAIVSMNVPGGDEQNAACRRNMVRACEC